MAITLRQAKGTELTIAEVDTNFTDLRDGVNLMVPKTKGVGLKVDSLGTPTFGWHDLLGILTVDEGSPQEADMVAYRGGIKARQFPVGKEAFIDFHMPHDYVPGTDIFIHVHWSHTSLFVTGGSVTWGLETMYSKGHNQGAFSAPITIAIQQSASTTQYQHMIAETAASTPGGSGTQFDTAILETDGIFQSRIYLDSNDLTVSAGGIPDPFVHFVDIHYQSTGVPTKQRQPDFWT